MDESACGQILELCDGAIFLDALLCLLCLLSLLLPPCGAVVEAGERDILKAR